MTRALLLASACLLLAAPAFAQSSPPNSSPQSPAEHNPTTQGAPAQNGPAAAPNDLPTGNAPAEKPPGAPSPTASAAPSTENFVKTAAISGLFEIRSSELALRKHVRPDQRFAEHMIRDHERVDAQLKHLVRADHIDVQLPTKLDGDHQKMIDQLRSESGTRFDKDYDQMQQQGHEQAVSLFQSYAQSGDNPTLKRWAAKTLPKLQNHLSMAQKLS